YDRVEQFIEFTEKNFYLTTGDLRLIKLEPEQKWWVELMLGYDMIDEKGRQVQLTTEFFLNLGRGSGKSSFMGSRELHWMTLGGQYGGESLLIAYDNTQARHVFEQVKNQAQVSPLFENLSEARQFKSTKTGLKFEAYGTEFKKQTNDTSRAQGGNSSLNIFDEVHTYGDDITEAVNKGSRQKQASWQSIYITSGGLKRMGLYDTLIERFTSQKEFENDRSFSCIYRLENAEQVKDKRNWAMAIPMIGRVPNWQGVIEEYDLAQGNPALQIKFLAYNMGLQMQDTAYYFTPEEATKREFDLSVFSGRDTYVGIDLSLVGDLTSVAFVTRDEEGVYYLHTLNFAIRDQYEHLDEDMKEVWLEFIEKGELILLDTDYINVNDVVAYIDKFITSVGANLRKVAYDPARYEILKNLIEKYFFDIDGDNQIPVRQGFSMTDYIEMFKGQTVKGNIKHNQDIMKWQMLNTAVKIGNMGGYMYTKKLNKEKIDGVVASTMALQALMSDGENTF
ncbi:terminase TerL endonuclease subunit, partial [Brucella sp. CMUL 015]|uniref:terminase TerL endonuclease subunit n=1 Tax=Brucella sp. CMUL 015 TaxID=1905697 RepID=UPI0009F9ED60